MTKTIKMNQVTPGTVISGELNKSSKSNSPIIITPVFTIARPGAPNEGTVCCVRESKVPVEAAVFFFLASKYKMICLEQGELTSCGYNRFSSITGPSPGHYRLMRSVLSQKLYVKRCPSIYLSLGRSLKGRLGGIH